MTLPQAQQKSFKVDFSEPEQRPFTPKVMGSIPFLNFPIEDVIDYIDWNPFFQVSGLGWGTQYSTAFARLIQPHMLSLTWPLPPPRTGSFTKS